MRNNKQQGVLLKALYAGRDAFLRSPPPKLVPTYRLQHVLEKKFKNKRWGFSQELLALEHAAALELKGEAALLWPIEFANHTQKGADWFTAFTKLPAFEDANVRDAAYIFEAEAFCTRKIMGGHATDVLRIGQYVFRALLTQDMHDRCSYIGLAAQKAVELYGQQVYKLMLEGLKNGSNETGNAGNNSGPVDSEGVTARVKSGKV